MKFGTDIPLLSAVVTITLAGLLSSGCSKSESNVPAGGRKSGPTGAPVEAVVVRPQLLENRVYATGSLRANEEVQLRSEISGRVTGIFFSEGSRVKKGTVLLTINDQELQAQLKRKQFEETLATDEERRQKSLLDINGVSRETYDKSYNNLKMIEADRELLETQIAKSKITAPFDGIIGLRYVSEGGYVTPSVLISTMQDIDPMKVEFSVPEKNARQIKNGTQILVRIGDSPEGSKGVVYAVESMIDPGTRTMKARATIPNPGGNLIPGSFGKVEVTLDRLPNAIVIPSGAVIPRINDEIVYVCRNGKAQSVSIKSGIRTESGTQIIDGLAPGDTLIVSGLLQLTDGKNVQITALQGTCPVAPMNISSVSINRPVLSTVLSILIVLFGGIGYYFLGVREYPSVDPPVVTVSTSYTGANADVIESQITEPLEESINGVAGIRSLTSSSSDGRSRITVEFVLGVDMETATNDVRDRVSRAVHDLPADIDPPSISKADADANPILAIMLASDKRSLLQLSEIANDIFKERLQTIPGVSEVGIWGEKRYAMKLELDPARLAAHGLTPLDVKSALDRENVELPSGRVEGYNTELSIRTFGRLTSAEEFNNLIIKQTDGSVVKLRDIGRAVLAPEDERSGLKGSGGIPMVSVNLIPQPGSNHIAIADEFYRRLDQIKKDLPEDVSYSIGMDTTANIRKAIIEVVETILIAFLLVMLVIFAFLRHWRTTIIPMLAIPISLIGAFFIMYAAGFSINILTLLAIVLSTGIVVDDAIVVLENIYKRIERGVDPIEAGHQGSKEILFAIISTTITLASVFLPIMFLQGLTGRLFREFGVVVAGSVLISAFVSLTLTPMMSARILHKPTHENKLFALSERWFGRLISGYHSSLSAFVYRRWLAPVIMVASLAIIIGVGALLRSELAPMEDKSRLMVNATAPEGTSYEALASYMSKILAVVDTLPEKSVIMTMTGGGGMGSSTSGFVRISLVPPDERQRSQQEIADALTRSLRDYTFARAYVTQEQTIGGGRGRSLPVQFVIQAQTFDKLRAVIPKFMEKAQADSAFAVVDLDLKFNKPEMTIEIDRERARSLGITVRDIASTLQLYFSGQRYGYFILNGKQYSVIAQADRQDRDAPMDISSIYVRSSSGELIQLDNLVKMSYRSSPPQLYHFNRYMSATISASMAKGFTLGDGIGEMDKISSEVLDESFSTSLAGTAKDYSESSNTLVFAFVLALTLVYLILAAQFESFRDPLIIMFTVPLALAGAVLSLWLFGQTLNIFSQIGIIALIGIVTKNGILIVEFANQRKAQGLSVREAVIDAAAQRFRPILMTSLATVFGVLPIALALGAAAKSRVSMGIVIIGGLLFSLGLTLYVIPALYTYLSSAKKSTPPITDSVAVK